MDLFLIIYFAFCVAPEFIKIAELTECILEFLLNFFLLSSVRLPVIYFNDLIITTLTINLIIN